MSNSNAMSRDAAELLPPQGISSWPDVGPQSAYRHIVIGPDILSACTGEDRRKILRTSRAMRGTDPSMNHAAYWRSDEDAGAVTASVIHPAGTQCEVRGDTLSYPGRRVPSG